MLYSIFMFSNQKIVLMIGDFLAFLIGYFVMTAVRYSTLVDTASPQFRLFALMFIVWLCVFFIFDLYTARRINPSPRNIGLILAAMASNTIFGVVFFYLLQTVGFSPKTNLLIVAAVATACVVLWRRIAYLLFTKRFARKIVLIGSSPHLLELRDELAQSPNIGTVVGMYPSVPEGAAHSADIIIGDSIDPQALIAYARASGAQPLSVFEAYELILAKIPVELMTDERALSYLTQKTTAATYLIYRCLEIIGASLVLIITSPFLAIGALAKWIEDGGPVLYSQERVGKNGTLFRIYKLRSMRMDAETAGALWADARDSRITRVGTLLRKSHLDEVPQMLNIIKGDLAAIGPRAERPEFVAQLEQQIPYYYLRHTIKPGFTGWAQIKYRYARSVEDSREKFEYDLYYLKNRSPLLDIGIILKTLQIIFTH